MPSPSKTWTPVTDNAIDSDSVLSSGGVLTGLRDQLVYLQEIAVNNKTYSGPLPHDHDSTMGSSEISSPPGYNFLLEACPQDNPQFWVRDTYVGDSRGDRASPNLTEFTTVGNATSGLYMYQVMLNGDTSLGPWGGGTALTLSFYAKMTAATSTGAVSIGLADGAGTPPAFTADHKGQATAASHLDTSWRRFFVVLDGGSTSGLPMSTHSTNATFVVKVETTFGNDARLLTTGFMVSPGDQLQPFWWCPGEGKAQNDYNSVPDCPLFDRYISKENAVELTAV